MRTFLFIAVSLLALPFVSIAQEDEPTASHVEAAERLLDNMNMQETLDEAVDAILTAQISQMPQIKNVEGVMREFFAKYMNYEVLKPGYIAIYVKHYTEQEIDELYGFYQTPLGKKLVATLPQITAEGSQLGQDVVKEHMPELEAAIMAKMVESLGEETEKN